MGPRPVPGTHCARTEAGGIAVPTPDRPCTYYAKGCRPAQDQDRGGCGRQRERHIAVWRRQDGTSLCDWIGAAEDQNTEIHCSW